MTKAIKQAIDKYTESILSEIEQSKDFKSINPSQDFMMENSIILSKIILIIFLYLAIEKL